MKSSKVVSSRLRSVPIVSSYWSKKGKTEAIVYESSIDVMEKICGPRTLIDF